MKGKIDTSKVYMGVTPKGRSPEGCRLLSERDILQNPTMPKEAKDVALCIHAITDRLGKVIDEELRRHNIRDKQDRMNMAQWAAILGNISHQVINLALGQLEPALRDPEKYRKFVSFLEETYRMGSNDIQQRLKDIIDKK